MIVRDFYFAAWVIEQGIAYEIKNGAVNLDLDRTDFNALRQTYNHAHKAYFERVRQLIRQVSNTCTSQLRD